MLLVNSKERRIMETISALLSSVRDLYSQGNTAYWLPPVVAVEQGNPIGRIQSGDSVIFCCRRGEREIQLTEAFTEPDFNGFFREQLTPLTFIPLIQYHPKFSHLPTAFVSDPTQQTLGEVISRANLAQLRMAEEEKFAHITYFLNGKHAAAFPNEFRASVASDLENPLLSLRSLVDLIPVKLREYDPSFTAINLATGDLLGHSDNLDIKKGCANAVDEALGSILQISQAHDMWTVITADHGLLEDHGLIGGPINTSHTTHLVPFIVVSPDGLTPQVRESGTLADVAPTILSLLGINAPLQMTGRSLLKARPSQAGQVLLLVLDGWGFGEDSRVNPINLASTPNWDRLQQLAMAKLRASGSAVGLIPGTKGNSESGHMTIGAGRPVRQDDARIKAAMVDGSFDQAPAFRTAMDNVLACGGALHLVGLLSRTSSHGSVDYVLELARLALQRGLDSVYLHLITDGRSSHSERLPLELERVGRALSEIGIGSVVTLVGRGYALDRGGDYEKNTRPAYEALVEGIGCPADVTQLAL